MSIRRDEAQLIITIDAKESAEYNKVLQETAKGVANIKKLEVGTEEYNKALADQVNLSKKLAASDYTKLSIKQIQDRRTQLIQMQKILPQVTFAEKGLEKELRDVNSALAENVRRTRAVGQEMQNVAKSSSLFKSVFAGTLAAFSVQGLLSSIKSVGAEIFSQIKKLDSLGKAYQKIIPDTKELARANQFLGRLANDFGLNLITLKDEYIKYTASAKSSTLALKDQELIFESVAKAGATLGLSTETQNRAFTALQQIMSKGKVSAEELKGQLGDALPGAVTIMAKALGVTTGELQKMLEKGEVLADEALPKFARELQRAYGVENVTKIDSINAAQNRFSNQLTKVVTVLGNTFGPAITRVFNGFSGLAGAIAEYISPAETAADVTRDLQTEFNTEIEVLKRLSPENEQRKEIIDQINAKYKDYLPNLLTEKSSLEDITAAQSAANNEFKKKLLFLAFEEELIKRQETIKKAIQRKAGAELSKIKSDVNVENLQGQGLSPGQAETAKALNASLKKGTLEGADRVIAETEKELVQLKDIYSGLAKELGTTLDGLAKQFEVVEEKATGSGKPRDSSSSGKGGKSKKEDRFSKLLDIGPILTQGAIRDAEIKKIQERELASFETFYLEGNISEEEYQIERNRIAAAWLQTRIDQLDDYGAKETTERKNLYDELLKLEKSNAESRAKQYQEISEVQLTQEEQGFVLEISNEEARGLQILQARVNSDKLLLEQLKSAGLEQTVVYRNIQKQLTDDQFAYDAKRAENTKRTEDLKKTTLSEGISYASDIFSLGADLLADDEKARKKNASAIKAFQISAAIVDGASEVASIWRNANASPTNALFPGYATAVGVVQTALAVGRTTLAVSKISKQKFAGGQRFQGRTHGQGGIDVALPDGRIGEVEHDEILINARSSRRFGPVLDYINRFNGWGKPLFETGARFQAPNTTPTGLSGVPLNGGAPMVDPRIDMLIGSMVALTSALPQAFSNIKAKVVYSDIESAGSTINDIRSIASYR